MAEPPLREPSTEYPIHLRTGVNIWAGLMVILYVASLYGWVRPETLKFILPSFGPAGLAVLTGKAIILACALAGTLAMGYFPGQLASRFIGMRGMGAGRIIPVGWAVSGTAIMGLGLAGLLYPPIFAFLALASTACALPELIRRAGTFRPQRPPASSLIFLVPAVAAMWALFLMLLAPEIFQDALRYHLFIPKRFNLEHKWFFIGHYFFWSYMGPFHALYGQALALGGVAAAKAVNFAAALVNFAAILRIIPLLGIPPAYRLITCCALITQPGLLLITGSVFAEHAMAVYVLLAFESMLTAGSSPFRAFRDTLVFLVLGFNTKFTAVFGLTGVALASVLPSIRPLLLPAIRTVWKPAVLISAALLAPWFAMKWLFTLDPVSPALAQAGLATMDASSKAALYCYYEFARNSISEIIQSPDRLLIFPFIFSGGHEGFWEHPGPVIPALIPLAILSFRNSTGPVKTALLFTAGSAAGWMAVAGGVSPHYVAALSPFWALSLVAALMKSGLRRWKIVSIFLGAGILFQSLIAVVVAVKGWFPATVATGELPVSSYLTRFSLPMDISYPIRKRLEQLRPHRGTTYVYGDDTSYYLDGRVFVDYEMGNHPLIWEFAAESPDPSRLRARFRQAGITHVLFSTRWPDALAGDKKVSFVYGPQTLRVMQDFWRLYSRPLLVMETGAWLNGSESYVFEISNNPRPDPYDMDFSKYPPRMPGACGLAWDGDSAWNRGDPVKAHELFAKNFALFPQSEPLKYRLAIMEASSGREGKALALLRSMKKDGWISPRLEARLGLRP